MRHLAVFALFLTAASLQAVEPQKLTTVILMRHAEKETADMSKDQPLSAAGSARALELARVLADANVSAIYTTPYKRTETTVAPLAAALGIKPIVVPNTKTYVADVVTIIRAKHVGSTVVVVGHSNTTPDVMRALGVADAPAIPDSQYDDLFVVTIGRGVRTQLVKLRYGAVTR